MAQVERKLFGTEIERYFDSDANMLAVYRDGEIYALQVIVDTDLKIAIWYTYTESEFRSNSCNCKGVEDCYIGAIEKLLEVCL